MRLLLDTCVALWWISDAPELTVRERELIADPDNEVYVSTASAWEVEIKCGLGKLDIDDEWKVAIEESGFSWLPVYPEHTEYLRDLPPIHKDPFDRMIVAQSRAEGFTVLTHDSKVRAYFTGNS